MADLSSLLAALELDPDDVKAYEALATAARQVPSAASAAQLAATRTYFASRHRPDVVAQLFDVELAATDDASRRADLWIEKGRLLEGELLDIDGATRAFAAAIELRSGDIAAREALDDLRVTAANWKNFARKFIEEAAAASDRGLAAALSISAAECYVRYSPDSPEAEQWLRRALDIDGQNARAAFHLERLLRRTQRWDELAALLDQRADQAVHIRDRVAALVALSDLARGPLGSPERAETALQRLAALDPSHPRAPRMRSQTAPANERRAATSSYEIAELAESLGNFEKAIEAWKQHLRKDPASARARAALERLYRRTEKWNALVDLLNEASATPDIDRLFQIAEIYRDHLKLDSMVIQTYQAILKIDPTHTRAAEELAARLRALERWNDVIALLTHRAQHPATPEAERLKLLREVADLWAGRLGNAANAIGPLEQIVALAPTYGDALVRLKEIYAKRRQWRQLIAVLDKEAATLPERDRVAKRSEMARIAAERLGDTRFAIELYNRVLTEASESDVRPALAALADLYEREKRHIAVVEIVHRQAAAALAGAPPDKPAAIAAFERLGHLYADRLAAPQQAAMAWKRVFELDPNHGKALRVLRELYLTSGDGAGLEPLFIELGLEEELIAAMHASANRSDNKASRLSLTLRAAALAEKRAATEVGGQAAERARQAWERVLAVEPRHAQAASALAAIYERQQKWPRLLAMREVELDAVTDTVARLAKIAQIRELCEHRLGSKSLALSWVVRAFEIDATDQTLYDEMLRLASDPDQWREVVAALERAIASGRLSEAAQLQAFRDLAKIAQKRLGDPEMARGYNRKVLQLAPADRDAELDLERLATQVADWNDLLRSLRRRAKRATDPSMRASVLVQAGMIQEQKLVDPRGAAASYREALEARPDDGNALRSLARVEEARGEWAALADVLAQELSLAPEGQLFERLMQLAALELDKLNRPAAALAYYRQALAMAGPGIRSEPMDAIARLVLESATATALPADQRLAAVRELLPHVMHADQYARQALALTALRNSDAATAAEKIDLDRALMRIADQKLGDTQAAWAAGLRAIAGVPHDAALRHEMAQLAGRMGRDAAWAEQLLALQERLKAQGSAPAQLREIATELAEFAVDRLSDHDIAEAAWISVLDIEADAADAFEALANLYRARQRWLDLRALLERRAEVTSDEAERLAVWLQLGELEDAVLGERDLATAAYRRARELDPTNEPAVLALERLYAQAENWPDLEALLASCAERGGDSARAMDRAFQRAKLLAYPLARPDRAVDLLETILHRDRSHVGARELLDKLLFEPKAAASRPTIAAILEPLYAADKLWLRHVTVLRVLRELADGRDAVELLERIAAESETELGAQQDAFAAWLDVLALEPANHRAHGELTRLAALVTRWRDLAGALEAAYAAIPPSDRSTRVALVRELAGMYETRLADPARAIDAYQRWRDADPGSEAVQRETSTALARLYRDTGQWGPLRDVLRMQAQAAANARERKAVLTTLATLEEHDLNDPLAAIATWREMLAAHPDDGDAYRSLERLFEYAQHWQALVDLWRQALGSLVGPDRVTLLRRIAQLCELQLAQPDHAIAAWCEVLDTEPDSDEALTALARLYRLQGRHDDLYHVLARQLAAIDAAAPTSADAIDPTPHSLDGTAANRGTASAREAQAHNTRRLGLQVEMARLASGPLARPSDALDHWRLVLDVGLSPHSPDGRAIDPAHTEALTAVEAALADRELWTAAADILYPVYVATAQYDALVQLLQQRVERADAASAKYQDLCEISSLYEHKLADKAKALEAQLAALSHAANEPHLTTAIAAAERLAGDLGRSSDLIEVYRQLAPDVLDADVQRRLYLDVADLLRAARRDPETAAQYYRKVLELAPSDARATAALENIYRGAGDTARLVEILLRQGTPEFGATVEDQVSSLVEAAGLYAMLQRPDDAIATWEQALAIAPDRADVIYALEKIYRDQGRIKDVIDLYERRLGFVTSIDEAVALNVQLAELFEGCGEVEAAVDNYAAALGGNATHPGAIAALERLLGDTEARAQAAKALEPIYVAQQRWSDLVRVYQAKLDATDQPIERLKLTRYVARLFEEQLEDYREASRWYARAFREAPSDSHARDQLQRLGGMADAWDVVADAYQGYLDENTEESATVRDVAVAVGEIYDRRLANPDLAVTAYRRALAAELANPAITPTGVVDRLEDVLGRTQRWHELDAVYEDIIDHANTVSLRGETQAKRARLFEDQLQDAGKAIEAWQRVVDVMEGFSDGALYGSAVQQLERLYRTQAQWRDLAAMLESQLERNSDPAAAAELRMKVAAVYDGQLDDATAAIEHYQTVIHGNALVERAVSALEHLIIHDHHREHIIELLEPVYRAADWWQKLVVILDAKLEYVSDAAQQIAILHEIADIHDRRGGALDLAFAALDRAWRIDVADDAALTKLLSFAGKLEAWNHAADAVEAGASAAPIDELAAGLWARAADIRETRCGDRKRAIEDWQKVDALCPNDVAALAALDRLLALEGRGAELAQIVARRAELTSDDSVRLVLLHRTAALFDEVVGDRTRAIAAYRRVLEIDDSDNAALDELERLYRDSGDARELAATLERKIELTPDDAARQMLHHSAAVVYEVQLGDVGSAITQLTAALGLDGGDRAALADLDRLYTAQKQWPDLVDVIDRRAVLADTTAARADLAYRAAVLVETEWVDVDAAVRRYSDVLDMLPSHPLARSALARLMQRDDVVEAAAAVLERVFRAERNVAGLAEVYERRLAALDRDPAARRADWQALAELYEHIGTDPARAFSVWARAWADDPEDLEVLAALTRLAGNASPALWPELAALVRERLQQPDLPPTIDQAYAMRLGQIAEDQLHDLDAAAEAFERASRGPEPRGALASLERVLARGNNAAQLAEVLARQAEMADSDAIAAEYLFRKGDLTETVLASRSEAIAVYIDVVGLVPTHRASRAALLRLAAAGDDAERLRIFDVLEPLLERDNDTAQLIHVLEMRLQLLDDALDCGQVLQRIAALHDAHGDRTLALDAALRWLACDPVSPEARSELVRLAEATSQWRETETRVAAVAADAASQGLDVPEIVSLFVFLGDIRRNYLSQVETAVAAYRAALRIDPEALEALDPLIELLRTMGAWSALADALGQRGNIVADPEQRRSAFAEIAQLRERAGDRFGAIAAWRTIAANDDRDSGALGELARLYRGSGLAEDRTQLIDVLGRAAQLAEQPADEKRLRVEIAELETAGPRAIEAWQAAVDVDPSDATSLLQLEAAYARGSNWTAVHDVQARRLDVATTASDKLAIYAEMARLSETKRGSIDDAIVAWFASLDIDTTSELAFNELERLLAVAERYRDLVELLQRRAGLQGDRGDRAAQIQTLGRAAELLEQKLDDTDAATRILEEILARNPGAVAALTRLSAIHERAGNWAACKAALEQALGQRPQGRDAADLYFRLGEVALRGDRDAQAALAHFHHAVNEDASHMPAIAALEQLARERGDAALLVETLQRRVAVVPPGVEQLDSLIEIAELDRNAGRHDSALTALSTAARIAPDDLRIVVPLADLYVATGQLDAAAPLYERLAAEARAARRMKDVAKFRQRQGGILEARGDRSGALAAYEEAIRINPTDVPTMLALGRLYFTSKEWDKASRIYQSLVLQNTDATTGISKGDVYWTLGTIHLELGHPGKAKSMWQRGLEIDPSHQPLRDALARID